MSRKVVAKFEKVSYKQFKKDFEDTFTWGDMMALGLLPPRLTEPDKCVIEATIRKIYDKIELPKRSTKGSAGYDFFSPITIDLKPGQTVKMPTGIKCKMYSSWVLKLYPRSGLGFKYRLQLNNTVGIIDSDYYGNENNEGHIMAKITNDTNENKTAHLEAGTGFMQGIFVEYGITEDDDASGIRVGGLGSTTK